MNKLNDACFGNNWSWRAVHDSRARIAVLPIIENGFGTKRLHYHCLFARPTHINNDKFQLMIELCWDETRNGGDMRNDVQTAYDSLGFLGYMTKELRTDDFDKFDEKNTHIYWQIQTLMTGCHGAVCVDWQARELSLLLSSIYNKHQLLQSCSTLVNIHSLMYSF